MGDEPSVLAGYRQQKLREAEEFLATFPGFNTLDDSELEAYKKLPYKPAFARSFKKEIGSRLIELHLILDERFPFSKPRVYIVDKSLFLKIPHINEDGFICVSPDNASFSTYRAKDLIAFELAGAEAVLTDGLSGANKDDFIDEFLSYWDGLVRPKSRKVLSLLNPLPPTRPILYYEDTGLTLLGENTAQCQRWLANFWGETKQITPKKAFFVWLEPPIAPQSMPKTSKEAARFIKDIGSDSYTAFINTIPGTPGNVPVVFGFQIDHQPVVAGFWLQEPNGSTPVRRVNGFRAGHAPKDMIADRYLIESPVVPFAVQRIDAEWIHVRGGGGFLEQLNKSKVLIIGCGSIGADVAFMLGKAGVGELDLIDGDLLSWDNIGRHLLGARAAGPNLRKDQALRDLLSGQLPHITIKIVEDVTWEKAFERNRELFYTADLIISTTGDWASECALNLVGRKDIKLPPIVFGWTEPNGCGGIALAVMDKGGCLACGMDEFGKFSMCITDWPTAATHRRAPACGGYYQPYGVVEIAPVKAMIAQQAIDILLGKITESELRAWIGSREYLNSCGGQWSGQWQEEINARPAGGLSANKKWPLNKDCLVCN